MRLKTLLLGSSAAMFVAGAGVNTAQAADPNPAGLIVTTMANYVEACNSNLNGVRLGDWCLTPSGAGEFTASYGTKLGDGGAGADALWGTTPGDTETVYVGTPTIEYPSANPTASMFSGFKFTPTFSILAVNEDTGVRLNLPIVGSGTGYIQFGIVRLETKGVTLTLPMGGLTAIIKVMNPGSLGWTDPTDDNTPYNGPNMPDVAFDLTRGLAGGGSISAGVNVGRRGNTSVPYAFTTVGAYVEAKIVTGALTFTAGADYDRVDAWGPLTAVSAYGAHAAAQVRFGNVTANMSAAYGRNYGGYTGYHYTHQDLGNYYQIGGGVAVAMGDFTVGMTADWNTGPRNDDSGLVLGATIGWKPSDLAPVSITLGVVHERQQSGIGDCNGLPGAGPCTATRGTMTVGVKF